MQTKISTRPFGGFPVLRCFPHLCRSISLAAGAGLLSVALLLAGCSKDTAEGPDGGLTEIIPHAGLPASVSASGAISRAAADPAQAMELWFVRSDERSAGVWGEYGTAPLKATRAGGSGEQALAFDLPQYYLTNGLKTRMTGWYPGGGAEAGGPAGYYDAVAGTVNWTIDGRQDILFAAPRQGSKTSAMPAFEFRHALTQLQFHVYAENNRALDLWGKILGVAVCGQRAAATFTPADAMDDDLKVTFTEDASAKFAAANFTEMTAPVGTKDDAAAVGDPVMIEPQEASCRLTVEVTTEKRGIQPVVVSGRTYLAGQSVKICIRLAEHAVAIDPEGCEIVPWDNMTQTGDKEVWVGDERIYPYVLNSNTLVINDEYGNSDATLYPTHEKWTITSDYFESEWDANTSGKNTYGEKFKVAVADAVDMDGKPTKMSWCEAAGKTNPYFNPDGYSACREYYEETDQSDKGQWHLPTVKELKMIYDNIGNLTAVNTPLLNYYWSVTGSKYNYAWRINFNDGTPSSFSSYNGAYVRCVRDL